MSKLITDEMVEKASEEFTYCDSLSTATRWRAALEAIVDDVIEACAVKAEQTEMPWTGLFGDSQLSKWDIADEIRSLKNKGD